jgi:hypothetical protein
MGVFSAVYISICALPWFDEYACTFAIDSRQYDAPRSVGMDSEKKHFVAYP